jgi:hypothetical protein
MQVDLASPASDLPPSREPLEARRFTLLKGVLQHCTSAAFIVSEEISTTYFTHSGLVNTSVGAA